MSLYARVFPAHAGMNLVSVDLEISKTQYKVVTTHTLTLAELQTKIKGVFAAHGEDGFKWKVDPRQSISGVPQEDLSFVTRSSVNSPLSVDDIIKYVRYLQGFQERAGHPSVVFPAHIGMNPSFNQQTS